MSGNSSNKPTAKPVVPAKVKRRRQIQLLLLAVLASVLAGLLLSPSEDDKPPSTPLQAGMDAATSLWTDSPRDFSEFIRDLNSGTVETVGIDYPVLLVTLKDDSRYATRALASEAGGAAALLKLLEPAALEGVQVTRVSPIPAYQPASEKVLNVLGSILRVAPTFLILALLYPLLKSSLEGIRRKPTLVERPNVRFRDVIGAEEAKTVLAEVRTFLVDPGQFAAVGARAPKGVMLQGAPGTGKTLLAKALAGEAGASFIAVDGSWFSSMFYGQGISRVSELFRTARENAPCVVFIDEVDGIGARSTGPDLGGGRSEENRIINRILVEMDGFLANESVIVVAATNHPELLDPAMRRAGRFDLSVRLTLPTAAERQQLFEYYLKKLPHEPQLDLGAMGWMTPGMTGADIENVVNQAAILAARAGGTLVGMTHLEQSVSTVQMGERSIATRRLMSDADRKRIAVHEAGHALEAHLFGVGQMDGVTIEPRGQALGLTRLNRGTELPLYGEAELNARLRVLLAGREAELLVYGNTTSGAADDLKQASELAIRMVTELGMSKNFGVLSLSGVPQQLLSSSAKETLLEEAKALLETARRGTRALMESNQQALDALVENLLEHETLSGEQARRVLDAATTGQTGVISPVTDPT